MAQKKKKGPAPRSQEPVKKKFSPKQVAFAIFAILMALLMIVPSILQLFV